ncbi:RNB domain-containing ribonuclease [Streptacidiphilus neutrinimicus]|uniref:RNB domain-containing ribonuclease n=1 Tax=Streptacidiphilus neutrinimicus TaxID=105420 RepID=UPI0005A76BBC|nr:RNB domain-containing ribonuclease [Streptacidiphilus neutrinimicus]
MPRRLVSVRTTGAARIDSELAALRARLGLATGFSPAVLAEVEAVSATPLVTPGERVDATDLPLFTIDPPDSRDLDQAMHLERLPGGGYRVHYAIADVAAWVRPGGAIDAEARRRVETLYFPDIRVPLHPQQLSEGAASLLPGQDVPVLLWQLDLDSDGELRTTRLRRALVRSRAKLDYAGVQRALDTDTAEEALALLGVIGPLREEREAVRGGISLPIPEQEVEEIPGDGYTLAYRAPLPADSWNAQISLLTGMAAAQLMITGGVGVLRTLPGAPASAVAKLHRVARALRVDWPEDVPYAQLIRSLDPKRPAHAAFLNECTGLLRGAAYTAFDGVVPPHPGHAAVAAPYAHCTAPLRRLVDRFAGEVCLALAAGAEVPGWARDALPSLPALMAGGDRRAHEVEHACVDLVEAALLTGREGELFEGIVIDVDERRPARGTVQLHDPAVRAPLTNGGGPLPLGEEIRVRLTDVDLSLPAVRFATA